MLAQTDLPAVIILNAATTSNVVGPVDDAECVGFAAPAAFTGTVRVQCSQNDATRTAGTWNDVKSAGSNVTMIASGLVTITETGFRWLRLVSSVVQAGGNVSFGVRKQYDFNNS